VNKCMNNSTETKSYRSNLYERQNGREALGRHISAQGALLDSQICMVGAKRTHLLSDGGRGIAWSGVIRTIIPMLMMICSMYTYK